MTMPLTNKADYASEAICSGLAVKEMVARKDFNLHEMLVIDTAI
jgi:hypothetical protein